MAGTSRPKARSPVDDPRTRPRSPGDAEDAVDHPIAPTEFPKARSAAGTFRLRRTWTTCDMPASRGGYPTPVTPRGRIPTRACPRVASRYRWPSANNPQTPTRPAADATGLRPQPPLIESTKRKTAQGPRQANAGAHPPPAILNTVGTRTDWRPSHDGRGAIRACNRSEEQKLALLSAPFDLHISDADAAFACVDP